MRSFEDRTGARWDVVAGRESWGAIVAIFVPAGGAGGEPGDDPGRPGIREAPLQSSSYGEAQEELRTLDDDQLRALLDESEPKRA